MKKAKLTLEEVISEINQRSGLPLTAVRKVLMAYRDITREAIKAEVECPILDIGVLTWNFVPPAKRLEFKNWFKAKNGKGDWIVQENADGYNRPIMRFFDSYKKEIKEASIVPYTESGAE